jgi:hypothetical protein
MFHETRCINALYGISTENNSDFVWPLHFLSAFLHYKAEILACCQ